MFTAIMVIIFCWLFFTAVKLLFKLTFGFAKVIGIILCVIALPTLVGGLLLASGFILLVPVILAGIACGIIKLSQ